MFLVFLTLENNSFDKSLSVRNVKMASKNHY